MNRKQLLALARANGYTGTDDLAALKAWIAGPEGIDIKNADGVAVDVDAAWAKVPARKAVTIADEPEADPEPVSEGADRNRRKSVGEVARINAGKTSAANVQNIRSEKATYKRKVEQGKAAFPDADTAEQAGAWLRSQVMKAAGRDYSQKANDDQILGTKDASTYVNSLGGATVPEEFVPSVIFLTEKFGVARKLANVVRMSRDTAMFPRISSPLSMTAAAEAGSMTATDVSWDNVSLTAKKYYCLVKSSTELLEDSAVNIADTIASQFARAQARSEDLAYFLGDGTSTYNHDTGLTSGMVSTTYVAQGSSNTWATETEADILNMIGRVEYVDWNRCAFACSRQWFWQVPMRLAYAKSGNTAAMTLHGADGGPNGENATLYGFPVYFTQVLPTATATTGNMAYFGDFAGGSMFGDRRDLKIDFSDQVYFANDQIAWRATSRFTVAVHTDGQAATYGPITALKTG